MNIINIHFMDGLNSRTLAVSQQLGLYIMDYSRFERSRAWTVRGVAANLASQRLSAARRAGA